MAIGAAAYILFWPRKKTVSKGKKKTKQKPVNEQGPDLNSQGEYIEYEEVK